MITRVYFLAATQPNDRGGTCESFRTVTYRSWFAPSASFIVNDFFKDASKVNNLPANGWSLKAFSRLK